MQHLKWFKADYVKFKNLAKEVLKDRVYDSYLLRYAYGIDASCYAYTPKIVVKVKNEAEVIAILKIASECSTPVTFRAAGSSLSGQACSDSVLVVANEGWRDYEIKENGNLISLAPGVIGADANERLKPFGTRIGPDPATINTAMIGGIYSNNSSGMCCGVAQNSYNTVRSVRVILLDGFVLDTADEASVAQFMQTHSYMVNELLNLREEIVKDPELSALIARKYKIKNTTGYAINSLLDFSDIKEILNHIFIGAEGTLGFISRVDYECVRLAGATGCGLLFYSNLDDAATAVTRLAGLSRDEIAAAEMMDYASLKSLKGVQGIPPELLEVPVGTSCILIQSEADDEARLDINLSKIEKLLADIPSAKPNAFSKDPAVYGVWWKIRKGLLPIAAGFRRPSATVITEDVCFKINDFCAGVAMLSELFKKYGFSDNAIIFGHALAGNLHFIITPDFNNPSEYNAFADLVEELSYKVSKMEGSIKAEHGTGRMIAPFVELEWGAKAYDINRRIKAIFDPANLLNPDVIITDDPEIYRKNLKAMSEIDALYNTCIECGACERNCPSRDLTLTPRQRIGLLREMARLEQAGDSALVAELKDGYDYYGQQTCAACSMCSLLCPLGIDTANIALSLRKKAFKNTEKIAQKVGADMGKTVAVARFALGVASGVSRVIGAKNLSRVTSLARKLSQNLPYAPEVMPSANKYALKSRENGGAKRVIYFSTCINRAFAPNPSFEDTRSLQEVFESICAKAGVSVIYPDGISKMCCGLGFENYEDISHKKGDELILWLKEASQNGEIDIVMDHSACFAHTITHAAKGAGLRIYELSEYLYSLLPLLSIKPREAGVLVHKQCELKKVKKDEFIELIAKACASRVYNIDSFACCGFAGQKGFFTPELNISATKDLKKEAKFKLITMGVSTSSTCEIGLSSAANVPFINVAYLLDSCC
ncbi:FAD-binding and (Fe-S)-binding domain-containing protein [Campylobacter sp. 19-13652]|uniref:FAD-binding and (Fe-S)-binding domain-containing protein n=1 Tax=Campylobacter sp. 19-13652 TaxID=2840180 RepID=UPI001C750D6B|nr:FAD-binding and (Fe-S)-binding domain-containing protein [Campylobacter sp. 19-13652]BCX79021.1 lactate dehydrogenase [Campylobacter sp. 19-13652]